MEGESARGRAREEGLEEEEEVERGIEREKGVQGREKEGERKKRELFLYIFIISF